MISIIPASTSVRTKNNKTFLSIVIWLDLLFVACDGLVTAVFFALAFVLTVDFLDVVLLIFL